MTMLEKIHPNRRVRIARYVESTLVVAAIIGIVGLTSFVVVAQHQGAKRANADLLTDLGQ